MLSNFNKFGKLKNAFLRYLTIYQICFIHYRPAEYWKAQNLLGK